MTDQISPSNYSDTSATEAGFQNVFGSSNMLLWCAAPVHSWTEASGPAQSGLTAEDVAQQLAIPSNRMVAT